jgi:hypothetical protein
VREGINIFLAGGLVGTDTALHAHDYWGSGSTVSVQCKDSCHRGTCLVTMYPHHPPSVLHIPSTQHENWFSWLHITGGQAPRLLCLSFMPAGPSPCVAPPQPVPLIYMVTATPLPPPPAPFHSPPPPPQTSSPRLLLPPPQALFPLRTFVSVRRA